VQKSYPTEGAVVVAVSSGTKDLVAPGRMPGAVQRMNLPQAESVWERELASALEPESQERRQTKAALAAKAQMLLAERSLQTKPQEREQRERAVKRLELPGRLQMPGEPAHLEKPCRMRSQRARAALGTRLPLEPGQACLGRALWLPAGSPPWPSRWVAWRQELRKRLLALPAKSRAPELQRSWQQRFRHDPH